MMVRRLAVAPSLANFSPPVTCLPILAWLTLPCGRPNLDGPSSAMLASIRRSLWRMLQPSHRGWCCSGRCHHRSLAASSCLRDGSLGTRWKTCHSTSFGTPPLCSSNPTASRVPLVATRCPQLRRTARRPPFSTYQPWAKHPPNRWVTVPSSRPPSGDLVLRPRARPSRWPLSPHGPHRPLSKIRPGFCAAVSALRYLCRSRPSLGLVSLWTRVSACGCPQCPPTLWHPTNRTRPSRPLSRPCRRVRTRPPPAHVATPLPRPKESLHLLVRGDA
mmetsp:Transcript_37591/g.98548  ORF Transcript_37591/g.98548 Transcript_37591/m.98548 type:complete len:274 (-) Transcript_37591:94-915(-)